METIFVQIVSYRDPECPWTLKELFEKAAHPERIFAGICWFCDEQEDKESIAQAYPHADQVRILTSHPAEFKGMGWARLQAQSLWRGEDYVLQINAHMRFEQGWDDMLVAMLAQCNSLKPVLSTCLPSYIPPDIFPLRDQARASVVKVARVAPEEPQLIHLVGGLYAKGFPSDGPTRCPFWVGSFLFARSSLMQEVPFDPYMFYYGENIAYSVRLWTHGYDIFEPDCLVLYNYWDSPVPEPFRNIDSEQHVLTQMRLRHLLRLNLATQSKAIFDLEQYGLGTQRTLADFWEFAGVNMKTCEVTPQAQNGQWDMAYRELMAREAPAATPRPRIFVQIAAYRDTQCQWTLKDMFEKAAHPDRVFAGVCWQYDPQEDKDCFYVQPRPAQVRSVHYHWKESKGVCWARNQTQHLWEGEEYTLMIDSHMRFDFDWDEKMIAELARCASPKAILTCYPAAYTPPHDLQTDTTPTIQRANPYSSEGDLRFSGANLGRVPEAPLRGAFIAAGFMFSRSDIIREVPYDPYLYFNQEELSLAARFFTYGWDIYNPTIMFIYHCYNNPDSQKKKRPLHWEDNKNWNALQDNARKRFDHLMGYQTTDDPLVLRDLMQYDMGDARTLAEYEAFCGIDFKNRIVSEKAMRAEFIENLSHYIDLRIYVPELDDPKEGQAAPAGEAVPEGADASQEPTVQSHDQSEVQAV